MGSSLAVVGRKRAALVPAGPVVPALVAASGTDATLRFLNFFATQIENDNTRAAYLRAAREFLAWCDGRKIGLLTDIQPVHVAAWIKQSKLTHSIPTVKLVRMGKKTAADAARLFGVHPATVSRLLQRA
jgi:hypothetical protein